MSLLPLLVSALLAPAEAASPGKADVCHWEGGSYLAIEVSLRSVTAHIVQHGDTLAGQYHADVDGDGYGDPYGATSPCPDAGYVVDASDCDDTDAAVNPGAPEIPYDGLDNDCGAGTLEDDLDADGFGVAEDCDDADPTVHPDAEEACDDGVDDNCDGFIDEACATSICPCYTEADLDAAYASWLDAVDTLDFGIEPTASCSLYDRSESIVPPGAVLLTTDYHTASVAFNAPGYDADGRMAASSASFYGVSILVTLDEGDVSSSSATYSCSAATFAMRYQEGGYVHDTTSFGLDDLTPEEAIDCVDLIDAWVADNGLTCDATP